MERYEKARAARRETRGPNEYDDIISSIFFAFMYLLHVRSLLDSTHNGNFDGLDKTWP